MNKHWTNMMKVFAGLLALGVWMPLDTHAQEINRLASQFTRFNGTEWSTSLPPSAGGGGGVVIFSKTVFVSAFISQTPVVFVTMSATGDGHGGAAHNFSCFVGTPCNSGNGNGTPSGWIQLQKHNATDDLHDNNINYTWCKVTTPGSHTVSIHMASSISGSFVFLETAHFFVDVAAPSGIDACTSTGF